MNKRTLFNTAVAVVLYAGAIGHCSMARAATDRSNPLHQHPTDYALHAAGGALVAHYMTEQGYSEQAALLTVLAIGLAKEYGLDKNPDTADAVSWVAGPMLYFHVEW